MEGPDVSFDLVGQQRQGYHNHVNREAAVNGAMGCSSTCGLKLLLYQLSTLPGKMPRASPQLEAVPRIRAGLKVQSR